MAPREMMRALIQPDRTEPTVTLATRSIPTPKPNTDEHLIRVRCVAPCLGELLWPKYFPPPQLRDDWIPCFDMSGTVEKAPESSPFQVGDEVYCRTNYHRQGAASDYTISVTDELARRPRRIDWAQSTAIPLSAQTAWQALFVHSGIGGFANEEVWRGKRVLVTAAAGSVGIWLVQLARLAGATVVGTCGSEDSRGLLQSLGASETIDYHETSLRDWGRDPGNRVDLIVDCVGSGLEEAWWALRDGGIIIGIVQPPGQFVPVGYDRKGARDVFFIMSPDGSQLEQITKLVEEGKCRSRVDSVWPLEQFAQAFERLDSRHARGKLIIDLSLNQ